MIIKLIKHIHILALIPLVIFTWFEKDIPLSIVLLASVGPIIDLIGNLLANRFNKDTVTAKALQHDLDIKDLKEKMNNLLLAQSMGRM
jgi:hypothetical protein